MINSRWVTCDSRSHRIFLQTNKLYVLSFRLPWGPCCLWEWLFAPITDCRLIFEKVFKLHVHSFTDSARASGYENKDPLLFENKPTEHWSERDYWRWGKHRTGIKTNHTTGATEAKSVQRSDEHRGSTPKKEEKRKLVTDERESQKSNVQRHFPHRPLLEICHFTASFVFEQSIIV